MKNISMTLLLASLLTTVSIDAVAGDGYWKRGVGKNESGGYTGGAKNGWTRDNGSGYSRGWGAGGDGQGNTGSGSRRSYQKADGSAGNHVGYTTHGADGSTQHKQAGIWTGANGGGVASSRSYARDAQGNAQASRVKAYSNDEGYTYKRSVTATQIDGKTYYGSKGTCYEPDGTVIPCR